MAGVCAEEASARRGHQNRQRSAKAAGVERVTVSRLFQLPRTTDPAPCGDISAWSCLARSRASSTLRQIFSGPTCCSNSACFISRAGCSRAPHRMRPLPELVHHVRKFFQGLQAGGVDCGHIPQTQNHDRRQFLDLGEDFVNLVGRAEKKWPVNTENRHVSWDIFML